MEVACTIEARQLGALLGKYLPGRLQDQLLGACHQKTIFTSRKVPKVGPAPCQVS